MQLFVKVLTASFALLLAAGCAPEFDDELGSAQQAIIDGQLNRGDPAVAALIFINSAGDESLCSGTLIASDVVLTAAHCLDSQDVVDQVAYFGSDLINADPDEIATIEIIDTVYNQNFDEGDLEAGDDIGMVRLARRPPGIEPIPLNTMPTTSLIGNQMRLVGWGRTTPVPDVPSLDDGGGAGIKRETTSIIRTYAEAFESSLSPDNLVAYQDTCQGDSGGPNFVTIDGIEYVAGITSFGTRDCRAAAGTRVDRYTDFITSYTGELEGDSATDGGSSAIVGGCSVTSRSISTPLWLLLAFGFLA
ncbi:MAG: trypsin-like serine protease, partial [Deltaproteobacteria bacterium]|nr:trypsin-like serine protease [Deltaproteobacteria bacterium]